MKKAVGIFKGAMALFIVSVLINPIVASAATAPSLGVSNAYAVFGKAGVTNDSVTSTTYVWGNVGADILTSITNLNDATQVGGTIIAPATGIQTAVSAAYDALDTQPATASLDLAGTNTVTPGVYNIGATTLNGTLTLDGVGVYIFRSNSSITTSGGGTVHLINGATACNVFWQIPTSMTIGTGSHVEGTIIAQTGLISMATGATLTGRALSITKQVTLDSNQITEPICAAPVATPVVTPVVTPVIASATPVVIPVVIATTTATLTTTTIPKLPNTGFSDSVITPWGIMALSGVLLLMAISTGLYLKKRA